MYETEGLTLQIMDWVMTRNLSDSAKAIIQHISNVFRIIYFSAFLFIILVCDSSLELNIIVFLSCLGQSYLIIITAILSNLGQIFS